MDYTSMLALQAPTINRFKLIYLLKASYQHRLFMWPRQRAFEHNLSGTEKMPWLNQSDVSNSPEWRRDANKTGPLTNSYWRRCVLFNIPDCLTIRHWLHCSAPIYNLYCRQICIYISVYLNYLGFTFQYLSIMLWTTRNLSNFGGLVCFAISMRIMPADIYSYITIDRYDLKTSPIDNWYYIQNGLSALAVDTFCILFSVTIRCKRLKQKQKHKTDI